MIIGRGRKRVIANIQKCVAKKQFHTSVELHDPVLNKEDNIHIIHHFWHNKGKKSYQILNKVIDALLNMITVLLTKHVQIKDESHTDLSRISSAFVTCNHYNQLDILPLNKLAMTGHKDLYFWTKVNNLVMHFPIGVMVRNANAIPVTPSVRYLSKILPLHQQKVFDQHNNWILVYPEQELWFNYRKPRPLQRGVYYYAAKMRQPIISCFVEIRDTQHSELFHRSFYKTKIILHVLPVIYPNPKLSLNEDVSRMHNLDYQQKVKAYEKAYGKKLDYTFSKDDIAGLKNKS